MRAEDAKKVLNTTLNQPRRRLLQEIDKLEEGERGRLRTALLDFIGDADRTCGILLDAVAAVRIEVNGDVTVAATLTEKLGGEGNAAG